MGKNIKESLKVRKVIEGKKNKGENWCEKFWRSFDTDRKKGDKSIFHIRICLFYLVPLTNAYKLTPKLGSIKTQQIWEPSREIPFNFHPKSLYKVPSH